MVLLLTKVFYVTLNYNNYYNNMGKSDRRLIRKGGKYVSAKSKDNVAEKPQKIT